MDTFTKDDMKILSEKHERVCVSVYLPTFSIEDKTKQNPVLLRDVVKLIKAELEKHGVTSENARVMTDKIKKLSYDLDFWLYSSDVLCLFLAEDEFYTYRLPLNVSEKIYIGNYYYTLPLFELLLNKDYYLLTIDEAGVRFYLGNRGGLTDLTTKDLRKISIVDIKQIIQREEIQSYRVENKSNRSKNHENVIYHGHGNEKDERKIRMKQFLEMVLDKLPKILSEDPTPVLLAGNEEIISYFQNIYPYHNLLNKEMVGDTQLMKIDELHQKSWKIVKQIIDKEVDKMKEQYCNLKSTDQISNQLEMIVPASFYGRVATLFANIEEQDFGTFEKETGKVVINHPSKIGDEDLENLSAIKTFKSDGVVYVLNLARMPDKTALNAIFRY